NALDDGFQFLGAIGFGGEVSQLVAGLQQEAQRLDLIDDRRRFEVVHGREFEVDGKFAVIAFQRVPDLEFHPRRHASQNLVEVISVNLNEAPVAQRSQRLARIAREIAHDANDERKLALNGCAFGFDFIADVYAWFAYAIEFVVNAWHRVVLIVEQESVRKS